MLLRDFADTKATCIKQHDPPVTQLSVDRTFATLSVDTPVLKLYKESWIKLEKLNVKEVCNSISIDPGRALDMKAGGENSTQSLQTLRIQPNPARSVFK
jgi:hypothetical protein